MSCKLDAGACKAVTCALRLRLGANWDAGTVADKWFRTRCDRVASVWAQTARALASRAGMRYPAHEGSRKTPHPTGKTVDALAPTRLIRARLPAPTRSTQALLKRIGCKGPPTDAAGCSKVTTAAVPRADVTPATKRSATNERRSLRAADFRSRCALRPRGAGTASFPQARK